MTTECIIFLLWDAIVAISRQIIFGYFSSLIMFISTWSLVLFVVLFAKKGKLKSLRAE